MSSWISSLEAMGYDDLFTMLLVLILWCIAEKHWYKQKPLVGFLRDQGFC